MNKEELKKAVKECGSLTKAAKKLGMNRTTLTKIIRSTGPEISIKPRKEPTLSESKGVGKDIMEFRKLHDKSYIVPDKIKTALSKLKDNWEYENNFYKIAGVSLNDLSNFRDEFSDYIVVLKDRRIWTGSKNTAKLLRGMLI